jgi:hypothetical protein
MTPDEALERLDGVGGDWTHFVIGPDVDKEIKPWPFKARDDADAKSIACKPPFKGLPVYRRNDGSLVK